MQLHLEVPHARDWLRCHGTAMASAGAYPDLRASGMVPGDAFTAVVLGGALASKGTPSFAGKITAAQLNEIGSYIEARSFEDLA